MPTPIGATEKGVFLAYVAVFDPQESARLVTELMYYEDVNRCIGRQLERYSAQNKYLAQCLGALTLASLNAVGIYYNQTGTTLTNANMIVNSTYTDITISASQTNVVILGASIVNSVILGAGVNLGYLYIGPAATLNVADSSATGAFINVVNIPFLRSTPGRLNIAQYGSSIGQVNVATGSYFGGYQADNAAATCASPVTSIAATQVTSDSLLISWTPPANYLSIDTFYRRSGGHVWILATEEDGDFMGDTGFTFRDLEENTFYEFKVATVCVNGGIANVTVTTQTNCCGAGNTMTLYDECEINVTIKTTPDGSTITLCNGVTIPAQYAPGATLVIPYLAGKRTNKLVIVDGANYQNFPIDMTTGTFNAAATSLGVFVDGNVVTVNSLLPTM